jgi:3-isopropylmalate/(R)-2-methylmalate dehydratase small subunit
VNSTVRLVQYEVWSRITRGGKAPIVAWRDAHFLVVGPNFGCGSSREHAVWGLLQLGIRALLGTNFAGIFSDNAANNGLLLVELPADRVATLLDLAADPARNTMTVDLSAQKITATGIELGFDIVPPRKDRGVDPIAATVDQAADIRTFEQAYHAAIPWLA